MGPWHQPSECQPGELETCPLNHTCKSTGNFNFVAVCIHDRDCDNSDHGVLKKLFCDRPIVFATAALRDGDRDAIIAFAMW